MVELEKRDWEEAKEQAERILKQAKIMRIVNENLLNIVKKELKKFPEEKVEENKTITAGVG